MFYLFSQYYIKKLKPELMGWLTKLVYSSSRIEIGRGFRADSVPRIIVDKNAKLIIGDNVEFRRNVEIRAHGTSVITMEHNVKLDRGIRILGANKAHITIGKGSRLGLYSVLNGGDSITIGEKVLISGFVYLQTSMHGYSNKSISIQEQGYSHAPVKLDNDVWLGTHVVIMPGCTLGKGAVVGSNAVVTKSVEEYSVVGGVPAKQLKERL